MSTEQIDTQVDQGSDDADGAAKAAAGQPKADGADQAAATPQQVIDRLQRERAELNDRMLRIAADFENFRRRSRKDMEDAGVRGMEGFLKDILPVLDNLDRAMDAASSQSRVDPTAAALIEGVRLVQRQFLGALERAGVKTFEAQGKPFDPQFHEAVQQVESDVLPPGTVASVFQRGYTSGSRLLRPALVAVVRGRPQQRAAQSGDDLPIDDTLPIDDIVI